VNLSEHGKQQCTICGEYKLAGQVWLLVAESHCEDKLKVLQWHDELARRHGMYAACCPAHVQELVVHWMTTGSLDYPFATVGVKLGRGKLRLGSRFTALEDADTRGARQLGELAVDRESVGRAIRENPESLQLILDELASALERETTGNPARMESADALSYGFPRQI
jgi:hypothetical protein